MKSISQKDTFTPNVHGSIIYNSQDMEAWKQPKRPSMDECIKKMRRTHTHTQKYYSAIKKKEILPFTTTWMDPEEIMLSEISQTEKNKY